MKFSSLLDPSLHSIQNDIAAVGRMQHSASCAFPELLATSCMLPWNKNVQAGTMESASDIVIGICPSFSLTDLRFLDIIEMQLKNSLCVEACRVFVCDLAIDGIYHSFMEQFNCQYDHSPSWNMHPICGIYRSGILAGPFIGAIAVERVFLEMNIKVSADDIYQKQ